jgi:hypothetical protein
MMIMDNNRFRIRGPDIEKESISRLVSSSVRSVSRLSSMDQRSIVIFLHLKGLLAKAKDLHTEVVQVLGSDAIAYMPVTKHIRNDVRSRN